VTGWRFPRGDLGAMVAAVKHVLSMPEELQSVTSRARLLMRDTITIDNMVAGIDRAIRRALALRPPPVG